MVDTFRLQADIPSIFSGGVEVILGTADYQDDCLQHMDRSGLRQFIDEEWVGGRLGSCVFGHI